MKKQCNCPSGAEQTPYGCMGLCRTACQRPFTPPAPMSFLENEPYPSNFDLAAWNFAPQAGTTPLEVETDITFITTLMINTPVTINEIDILLQSASGTRGPSYAGIYEYTGELLSGTEDISPLLGPSAGVRLQGLPLNDTVHLTRGRYYVLLSLGYNIGPAYTLVGSNSFMDLLQNEPYASYVLYTMGLPDPLVIDPSGFTISEPFVALR